MHRGYVKIWRKMIESQVFSMGLEYIGLISYLLVAANYNTGWFMGLKVDQGQIACGIPKMAERLSVSRSKLYRMLKKLEEIGIIEQQVNSKFTLITICNYSTYQGQYCDGKQESEQQVNSERTAS
jgi:biotin operon repressor